MMTARMEDEIDDSKLTHKLGPKRPTVYYFDSKAENDQFPDPSLMDLPDEDKEEEARYCLEEWLHSESTNGLPDEHISELRTISHHQIDTFITKLSAGPPDSAEPLNVFAKDNVSPFSVKPRKFSSEKWNRMQKLVA